MRTFSVLLTACLALLVSCKKETLPEVVTLPATIKDATHVSLNGNVVNEGSTAVTGRGFCWALSADPTVSDNFSQNEFGPGEFAEEIQVVADTTYYIRAYAANNKGTSYGVEVRVNTSSILPRLETLAISEITANSARSGGTISSDGGMSIVARGVCWSALPNPTVAHSKTADGAGKGSFVSNLTGLWPNRIYFVRAYASNSARTAYGPEFRFTTLIALPTVTTAPVVDIIANTAVSGGTVTDDGGSPVTARGVCWSTSEEPTTENNKTMDGSGTGTFSSEMTGLTTGVNYFVRAYAINPAGTSYGNQMNFLATDNLENLNAGWHFNEGTGTTATDFTAFKHVATFYRGSTVIMGADAGYPSWVAGVRGGKAIYLTGGAHLEVPYTDAFLPANLSISVWVKPDILRDDNYIVSQNYWNGYKLQTQGGGKPFFTYKKIDGGIIDADNEVDNCIRVGQWNHIVVTVNAITKELKFFVNGTLTKTWTEANKGVGPLLRTLTPAPQPFIIGGVATDAEIAANFMEWTTAANLGYFKGAIDELKIFRAALTEAQVLKIYNDEKP